jgi:hypothetical protein
MRDRDTKTMKIVTEIEGLQDEIKIKAHKILELSSSIQRECRKDRSDINSPVFLMYSNFMLRYAGALDQMSVRASRHARVLGQLTLEEEEVPVIGLNNLTPKEKVARSMQKTANYGMSGGFNTTMSNNQQFFSPQLSTDFLELPQSLREKREIYRHFYNTDPIVGQSIDLHTELPLSKVRLAIPKPTKWWDRLIILPIDQVKMTSYSFTDMMRIEMIPSDRDKALIEQAKAGDEFAAAVVQEFPMEVREHIEQGRLIPLGTDPDEGSFCYYLSGRKSADEEMGQSILDRILRTLMYREKLRQAQTQIASRAMTPKRIVWGDRISEADVYDLRDQVDLALVDPDYSIVTNYEVRWEEMGARDRLLDLSSEYDITDKQLYAGLGVTESLLSGEAMYSGDRLKLEVINTRYLFLREMVQEYVEKYLFAPVARRKGFVEKDAWGDEVVVYPRLAFTRLPLRDSQDTYDALFNLYQKGSLDIGTILDLFNIDAEDTRVKLENDMFTVNDSLYNEVIRGIYSSVSQKIVDETNITERLSENMKLEHTPPTEGEDSGGGRW